MRNLTLFWVLVFSVLISFSGTALAASAVYDDLWDISQGAIVGDHSAVHHVSNIEDMFGGTGNTIFADVNADGFVHYVEWETPNSVTLQRFNLLAAHDGGTSNRIFKEFNLFYGDGLGSWTKIYNWSLQEGQTTYGGNPNNLLELEITINPVIAKYFKAEFDQAGIRGPRIVELDGYGVTGAPVPVPGAVWLLGTGLISLAGIRRRNISS